MITNRAVFSLVHLSDGELLSSLGTVVGSHRRATAELIAHLAEMDARKLYLSQASSSLFVYCVQRLGFGEDEACRRIDAARLAHRFPLIYALLESGEVSLSVLGRLKAVITPDNAEELLALVRGKSVRDAERLLAGRFPKPDVPDRIRKLPDAQSARVEVRELAPLGEHAGPSGDSRSPITLLEAGDAPVERNAPSTKQRDARLGDLAGEQDSTRSVNGSHASAATREHPRATKPGKVTPLSTDRFQVTLTISRAQEAKLRLALDLTSHENPRRELATVIEAALDLLVSDRMKRKFGKTTRPQKKKRPAKRTHVASATRRAVVERDGLQCSFVDASGRRCGETRFLELDHVDARALGGGSEKEKVRVLCRAHNQGEAERVFGREYVDEKKRARRKLEVREPALSTRYVAGRRLRLAGRSARARPGARGPEAAGAAFRRVELRDVRGRRHGRRLHPRAGARVPIRLPSMRVLRVAATPGCRAYALSASSDRMHFYGAPRSPREDAKRAKFRGFRGSDDVAAGSGGSLSSLL